MYENLGYAATILLGSAYLVQIWHIRKRRCAKVVDLGFWSFWSAASVLLFAYAALNQNMVFVSFTGVNLFFSLVTIFYSRKYGCVDCTIDPALLKKVDSDEPGKPEEPAE
jgi:lipid-A-disaccharide synthase-like uncharacterized protein